MKKLSAASTCEKNLDLLSINRGELADASECVLQWWPVQCQWPCSQSCKNLKMKGCNRISNHKRQSFKQFEGSNSNANCSIWFLLLLAWVVVWGDAADLMVVSVAVQIFHCLVPWKYFTQTPAIKGATSHQIVPTTQLPWLCFGIEPK